MVDVDFVDVDLYVFASVQKKHLCVFACDYEDLKQIFLKDKKYFQKCDNYFYRHKRVTVISKAQLFVLNTQFF